MRIAAYVRVSAVDRNGQRQMRAVRTKYTDSEQENESDWYCLESGRWISHARLVPKPILIV